MDKRSRRFSYWTVLTKSVNGNKETIIVNIENFVNLPKNDYDYGSINVQACSHEWKVRVYPMRSVAFVFYQDI